MVVVIYNITDGPGKTPTQADIYNRTLNPGESMRLPAELVDKKVRSMESAGIIAIGSLPSWYEAAKKRRGGKVLTREEVARRLSTPETTQKKEEALVATKTVDAVPACDGSPLIQGVEHSEELFKDRKKRR